MLSKRIILVVCFLFSACAFGMEKNKSNTKFSKDTAANESKKREKTSSTASSDNTATKKQLKYEIITVKEVKNQFDANGGGKASCGYHALKNACLTLEWISGLQTGRRSTYKKFKDTQLIKEYFGEESALWRSQIIALRKKKFATDFIRDQLLGNLIGAKKTDNATNTKERSCALNCEKTMKVIFEALPKDKLYSEAERDALYNILTDVATRLIEKCNFLPNVHFAYTVSFEDIKQALRIELKQKVSSGAPSAYSTVNNEGKIKAYFPKLNRISFSLKAEGTLIAHHENNKIYKRSYKTSNNPNDLPPEIQGEWLSSEELDFLVKFERGRKGKALSSKLASTPIFFLEDQKDNPLEHLIAYDSNFKEFAQKLQDPTQTLVGVILPYWSEHWVACVINKRATFAQFIFLNSASNREYAEDKDAVKLVELLTKKTFAAAPPSQTESEIPASESKTFVQKCTELSEASQPAISADKIQEPEMPESSRFKKSDVTSNDYVGELPKEIKDIIRVLNNIEFYRKKLTKVPNMLLLHGPSGTGKSLLAKLIASNTNRPYAQILAANLLYSSHGKAELNDLFQEARNLKKPVVIFINKINAILKADTFEEQRRDLRDVLSNELDAAGPLIFCIGTANDLTNIDTTMKKHYADYCIKLPLPDATLREKIIQHYMAKTDIKNGNSCRSLAVKATGFSHANLESFVNKASIIAQREKEKDVTVEDFRSALKEIKAIEAALNPNGQALIEKGDQLPPNLIKHITKIRVKSHTNPGGGGEEVSGWHALKNAFFILYSLAEPSNKVIYTKCLEELSYNQVPPIAQLKEEAIKNRLSESLSNNFRYRLEGLLFNALLLQLRGASITDSVEPDPNRFTSKLMHKDEQVIFTPLETKNHELLRFYFYTLLPKVAQRLINLLDKDIEAFIQNQHEWSKDVTQEQIIDAFINEHLAQEKEKAVFLTEDIIRISSTLDLARNNQITDKNLQSDLLILAIVIKYFFPSCSLKIQCSLPLIKELQSNQSLHIKEEEYQFTPFELQSCANHVVNYACSLSYAKIIQDILLDSDTLLSNSEPSNEYQSSISTLKPLYFDLNKLKRELQSQDREVILLLFLLIDNQWITFVAHKAVGSLPHYFIADSNNNQLPVSHPSIVELTKFLNGDSLKETDNMITQPSSDGEFVRSEPFPYESDGPSLEQIFNGKIPNEIELLIPILKNPFVLYGEFGTSLSSGLLLYGPPGTGKNMIVQHLITLSKRKVFYKSGGNFATKWKASAKESLKRLFEEAAEYTQRTGLGAIIFIDEIDGLAKSNTSTHKSDEQDDVIAFIKTLMNEYNDNPNIFFVATTNNKKTLDSAICNRFTTLLVDLPNQENRLSILKYYSAKNKINITNGNISASTSRGNTSDKFDTLSNYFTNRALNVLSACNNIGSTFDILSNSLNSHPLNAFGLYNTIGKQIFTYSTGIKVGEHSKQSTESPRQPTNTGIKQEESSRQSTHRKAKERVLSQQFIELIANVTAGLSARELKRIVWISTLKFIFDLDYQITRENSRSMATLVATAICGEDSLISKLFSTVDFVRTNGQELLSNTVNVLNLDMSPEDFINSFKLLYQNIEKLLPMERYIYETVLYRMRELAREGNPHYKEQATKYFNAAKNLFFVGAALGTAGVAGGM